MASLKFPVNSNVGCRILCCGTFFLGVFLGSDCAWCQTTGWTNPAIGNWFVGSNWNAGIPQPGSIAEINNNGLAFVDAPGAVANFLELGGNNEGFAEVSGAGRLTLSARIFVDRGALSISSGGQVNVLNSTPIGAATFVDANSRLRVTGNGSYLNAGSLTHGLNGANTSSLEISNGGRVDSSAATMYSGTSISVSGVNSRWQCVNYLQLYGAPSAPVQLQISNGGSVANSGYMFLQHGQIEIAGAGSFFSNGDMSIGASGKSGFIGVTGGGRLTNQNMLLGDSGSGVVNISGVGSIWNNSGSITVANSGGSTGSVDVRSGGRITSQTTIIGKTANANGSGNVSGAGTSWNNTGDVIVGESGMGNLNVFNQGAITSLRSHVGFQAGSNGSISVTDVGSTWTAAGSFFIGNAGTGSLQVLNGGVASTTGNGYLGFSTGAVGNAVVDGAGSRWGMAGELNIGGNSAGTGGTGKLKIQNGGIVNATGGTNLYNTGTLELANATTFTGELRSYGGLIRTTGTTTLANEVRLNSGGVNVVTNTPAATTTFSGNIIGTGGLTKNADIGGTLGQGTLILSGNNSYSGPTTVNAGRLLVNGINASSVLVNAGMIGGNGVINNAVVVGNNNGTQDAIIAPGTSIGTLTTGDLTLNSDAMLEFELDSDNLIADLIDVLGTVSLDADSFFSFADLGTGELAEGQSFVVINNDGLDLIDGEFQNIAEGFVFSNGLNTFQASYIGGTGNDFSLTAVPEPGSLALLLVGGLSLAMKRRRLNTNR